MSTIQQQQQQLKDCSALLSSLYTLHNLFLHCMAHAPEATAQRDTKSRIHRRPNQACTHTHTHNCHTNYLKHTHSTASRDLTAGTSHRLVSRYHFHFSKLSFRRIYHSWCINPIRIIHTENLILTSNSSGVRKIHPKIELIHTSINTIKRLKLHTIIAIQCYFLR